MTSFNYRMMDEPLMQMFPNASDILTNSATAESVRPSTPVIESASGQDGGGTGVTFPTNSSAYSGASGQSLLSMLAQQQQQQEPRHGDTASVSDLNFRMGSMDLNFDTASGYYPGNASRAESETSRGAPAWTEGATNSRVQEQMNSFEFLVKSVFAANNFVSMLTREQLSMLQSLRPSLLYQFLQDIARARSEKRASRWVTHQDCAFCKNNGESEECYSSHPLKDWRGRVKCPVLRAFRCPRCGATGDYAHTIKYCQQNNNADHERSGGLSSRRRGPTTPLLTDNLTSEMLNHLGPLTPNPATSPGSVSVNTPMSNSNVWSSF